MFEFMQDFQFGFQWIIFLGISIFILMFFPVLLYNHRTAIKYNVKFFYIMIGAVAISSFIMFLPVNLAQFGYENGNIWQVIIHSVFNTVQIFTVRGDISVVTEKIPFYIHGWIKVVYQCFAYILYVIAPCVTLAFSLSFLQSLAPNSRCRKIGSKDIYAFSELNEKSLALAQDYRRKDSKAVIIFADVGIEIDTLLFHEARKIYATCLKNDITMIRFKQSKNREIPPKNQLKIFLIGHDEDQNLIQAIQLIKKYMNMVLD